MFVYTLQSNRHQPDEDGTWLQTPVFIYHAPNPAGKGFRNQCFYIRCSLAICIYSPQPCPIFKMVVDWLRYDYGTEVLFPVVFPKLYTLLPRQVVLPRRISPASSHASVPGQRCMKQISMTLPGRPMAGYQPCHHFSGSSGRPTTTP